MAIIAESKGSGDFEKLKSGTYQAICIGVYDIGLETFVYQGEEKTNHKVVILWEVNERYTKGEFLGKRFLVSKKYTLSLSDKANLRKDLESWQGRTFGETEKTYDIEKAIGRNCLLNIVLNDKGYPDIKSITPLMNGMQPIIQETPKGYIPEWLQKKVVLTSNNAGNVANTFDGDMQNDPYLDKNF
jgi:hypothetical protein